jgi:hypothetical protein
MMYHKGIPNQTDLMNFLNIFGGLEGLETSADKRAILSSVASIVYRKGIPNETDLMNFLNIFGGLKELEADADKRAILSSVASIMHRKGIPTKTILKNKYNIDIERFQCTVSDLQCFLDSLEKKAGKKGAREEQNDNNIKMEEEVYSDSENKHYLYDSQSMIIEGEEHRIKEEPQSQVQYDDRDISKKDFQLIVDYHNNGKLNQMIESFSDEGIVRHKVGDLIQSVLSGGSTEEINRPENSEYKRLMNRFIEHIRHKSLYADVGTMEIEEKNLMGSGRNQREERMG